VVARDLVSAEPPRPGDRDSVMGVLQRLCRAAARDLGASGAGVSLLSESGELVTAAASSPTSLLVEELQFTVGEGPCLSAYTLRGPVLVPDLARSEVTWPGYAPAAHDLGVRAVFAFPLQLGVARHGVLDVYRTAVGSLSRWAVRRALGFAEVALGAVVDARRDARETELLLNDVRDTRLEVYQAQGMVMVQLRVSAGEAMSRLRAHAYAHDMRLHDVALAVLTRRLVLSSDQPS
jgi:hypothetical protein